MKFKGRCDFHTHTFLSDGELIPSEHIRRASFKGYSVIGITDHVDFSNVEHVLSAHKKNLKEILKDGKVWDVHPVLGVEITHVPKNNIKKIAKFAKELGAGIVIVHGETLAEPVECGTNRAALECEYVDILAHPGILSLEEAEIAKSNDIYLEISARKGHCLANGHVVKVAKQAKADLLVNTDAHSSGDMLCSEDAFKIALGSGLDENEAFKVVEENPVKFMKRLG